MTYVLLLILPQVFARIIYSSFWNMRHYTPTACCHVMSSRIYKIRLLYIKLVTFLTIYSDCTRDELRESHECNNN